MYKTNDPTPLILGTSFIDIYLINNRTKQLQNNSIIDGHIKIDIMKYKRVKFNK